MHVHANPICIQILTIKRHKTYFLILGLPEVSIPNVSTGIITYKGTLFCLDDNIVDLDFSRSSMLQDIYHVVFSVRIFSIHFTLYVCNQTATTHL
jgi:hypothetical protein